MRFAAAFLLCALVFCFAAAARPANDAIALKDLKKSPFAVEVPGGDAAPESIVIERRWKKGICTPTLRNVARTAPYGSGTWQRPIQPVHMWSTTKARFRPQLLWVPIIREPPYVR